MVTLWIDHAARELRRIDLELLDDPSGRVAEKNDFSEALKILVVG